MGHLSDFSYVERSTMLTYLWFFIIYRIWQSDRFTCLSFRRLRNFELKSIVTLALVITVPFQLYYEITSIKITYSEGFVDLPGMGIIAKPRELWTTGDQDLVQPTDYSLMIGFSFQTATLFLLQSFWNYLAGSVANATFMGSFEFKSYIVWTFCTIIMFPMLQFAFRYDDILTEAVPELAYGITLFIVSILGVRSHFRFHNLIILTQDVRNSNAVASKLRYCLIMNKAMIFFLFSASISFIILSADAITPQKYINMRKFPSDLLICNAGFCDVVVWCIVTMIVHPPVSYKFPSGSSISQSNSPPQLPKTTLYENGLPVPSEFELSRARSQRRAEMSPTSITFPTNRPVNESDIVYYPTSPTSPRAPVYYEKPTMTNNYDGEDVTQGEGRRGFHS